MTTDQTQDRQLSRIASPVQAGRTNASHMMYICGMAPKKTSTLNLRIDPALKEAARIAAIREHRSVANLMEWLIRQHCEAAGIPIPEQSELFQEPDHE